MGTPEIRTSGIRLIESPTEVEHICKIIADNGRVAIDTEFVWERTYYPNLGIVQLAINDQQGWLLDIPALAGNLEPLGEIITNPAIEKILHDAKQDLTILHQETGFYPQNIFDTRLAAGFIGPSATLSLLDSCALFANITLDKGETRSNWLRRPLSEKQMQYALNDVLFLPQIRDKTVSQAKILEREDWLFEEMKLYNNSELYNEVLPEQVYLKVKGLNRLTRKELAILQKLAAWRELKARTKNRPRRHILSDESLLKMAQEQPRNLDDLKKHCTLSMKSEQRYGVELLKVVALGLQTPEPLYPTTLKRSRNPKLSDQSRKILDFIADTGKTNQIDPALIATRKEVEKFLSEKNPDQSESSLLNRGWRFNLVGKTISP